MKRMFFLHFGSVRSWISPGSTVTSNPRFKNRQMRDICLELSLKPLWSRKYFFGDVTGAANE